MAKKASSSKKTTQAKGKKTSAKRSVGAKGGIIAQLKAPARAKKPAKCPLSKSELREYKQLLLDKRRSLIGDMNGMAKEALRSNRQDGSGDLSKIPTHDADVGTDNYEQEFTLGLLESERVLLAEINDALRRIDSGTYGICLGTGKPIRKERLRARPWAKYSIEYARMLEKGLVSPPDESRTKSPEDEDEDVEEELEAEESEQESEPEQEDSVDIEPLVED